MVSDSIIVPAAAFPTVGGTVIRHEFSLGRRLEYRTRPDGRPLSAAEYANRVTGPTLGELYQAFYGAVDGEPTCPAYREAVYAHLKGRRFNDITRRGEYTSTWIYREPTKHGTRNNQEVLVIERPEQIVLESGVWVAKGGKQFGAILPSYGWILEMDPVTGFPVKTTLDEDGVRKVHGKDTSFYNTGGRFNYSWGSGFGLAGLHPVIRNFGAASGPFNILTNHMPDGQDERTGIRQCYREGGGLEISGYDKENLRALLLAQSTLLGMVLRTGLRGDSSKP